MAKKLIRFSLLSILLGLLVVGGCDCNKKNPLGVLVEDIDITPTEKAIHANEGGSIESAGYRVDIPPGALAKDVKVIIGPPAEKPSAPSNPDATMGTPVSIIFESAVESSMAIKDSSSLFTPSSGAAIKLWIPYQNMIGSTAESCIRLFKYVKDGWEYVEAEIDANSKKLVASVTGEELQSTYAPVGLVSKGKETKITATLSQGAGFECDSLETEKIQNIYIVAHSMGGVVVRQALYDAQKGGCKYVPKVKKVALLGTPNYGSPVATGLLIEELRRKFIKDYLLCPNPRGYITSLLYLALTDSLRPALVDLSKRLDDYVKAEGISYNAFYGTKFYLLTYLFFLAEGSNDGMVSVRSAKNNFDSQEIDDACHGDLVGAKAWSKVSSFLKQGNDKSANTVVVFVHGLLCEGEKWEEMRSRAREDYKTCLFRYPSREGVDINAQSFSDMMEDMFGKEGFGTITGKVTDSSTGGSISGATVAISPLTQTVSTNSNGNYTISNVPEGTYTVTASKTNSGTDYDPNSVQVTVRTGQTATANIQLSPITGPTGTISVTTTPVSGDIYIDEVPVGKGAYSGKHSVGDRIVSFGSVSGYTAPPPQSFYLNKDEIKYVTGTYEGSTGLSIYSHSEDDQFGNSNGQVNSGEKIIQDLTLKNYGSATANSVTATLSESDSYVTIQDNYCSSWGNIGAGSTKRDADAFTWTVNSSCPNGHVITFTVTTNASNGGPWTNTFNVTVYKPGESDVRPYSHSEDDQFGNSNGQVNSGEKIIQDLTLKNYGSATANSVTATLSESDSYVTIQDNYCSSWGNIGAGSTKRDADAFTWTVNSSCPNGHVITFTVTTNASNGGPWTNTFNVTVYKPTEPEMTLQSHSEDDQFGNSNGQVNPGEQIIQVLTLKNTGDGTANSVTTSLDESDPYVTINDSSEGWGNIGAGSTKTDTTPHTWTVSSSCPSGRTIAFTLRIDASNGGPWVQIYYVTVY